MDVAVSQYCHTEPWVPNLKLLEYQGAKLSKDRHQPRIAVKVESGFTQVAVEYIHFTPETPNYLSI